LVRRHHHAVRPGTAEVYVAISYGAERTPALFVVTSDGKARRFDLAAARSTSATLRDAPPSTRNSGSGRPSAVSR
jgi:hypothetical protein